MEIFHTQKKKIDLQSSGRQLDLNINYLHSLSDDIDIGININQMHDYNHIEGNNSSLGIGFMSQYNF